MIILEFLTSLWVMLSIGFFGMLWVSSTSSSFLLTVWVIFIGLLTYLSGGLTYIVANPVVSILILFAYLTIGAIHVILFTWPDIVKDRIRSIGLYKSSKGKYTSEEFIKEYKLYPSRFKEQIVVSIATWPVLAVQDYFINSFKYVLRSIYSVIENRLLAITNRVVNNAIEAHKKTER